MKPGRIWRSTAGLGKTFLVFALAFIFSCSFSPPPSSMLTFFIMYSSILSIVPERSLEDQPNAILSVASLLWLELCPPELVYSKSHLSVPQILTYLEIIITAQNRVGFNPKWPMSLQKGRFVHRHKHSGGVAHYCEDSTNKWRGRPGADLFLSTLRENWTFALLGFRSLASTTRMFLLAKSPRCGTSLHSSTNQCNLTWRTFWLHRPALVPSVLRKLWSFFHFDKINYLTPPHTDFFPASLRI